MDPWRLVMRLGGRLKFRLPWVGSRLMLAAARRKGEPELAMVRRLADPAKMAIDIGANWGPYTGMLANHVTRVVAFEPNPVHAAAVMRAWSNRAGTVSVEQAGVSDENGAATLRIPFGPTGQRLTGHASIRAGHGFQRFDEIEIPIRRLDDYNFTNVGFIKIDIEGNEVPAVKGAWQTIVRERPVMLIESMAEHAPGCPEELVELLAGIGYSAWYLDDGTFHPFSAWSPDVQSKLYDGPINNFIFTPTPAHP